jgi:A/G-specific adenine glycosylase
MPWKGEKDPYKIWLSEIILQQTRVDQGMAYYENFISEFSNIHSLAAASEQKVFKLWEGLGYYSRCRNLITTAKFISEKLNGKFPDSYDEIRSLKGIGPYTAAAISSFAYNHPYAVVDGNVSRVLSRVFGVVTPIDTTTGKKEFAALAQELLDKKNPGIYNQAIMDFGATICKPAPLCNKCQVNKICTAFLQGKQDSLPVKEKKILIKKRKFYYLVMEYKGRFAIRQRTNKDIWQQLYEFPFTEISSDIAHEQAIKKAKQSELSGTKDFRITNVSESYKQQLSHQHIEAVLIKIILKTKPVARKWSWISKNEIDQLPFPGMINQYMRKNPLISSSSHSG